jgi:VanZ family protein
MKTFLSLFWKTLLVAVFILYACIIRIPGIERLPEIPNLDKLVHFLFYVVFSVVLFADFIKIKTDFSFTKTAVIVLFIATLYGGIIELLQENFFPPRSGDLMDLLADFFGAFAGVIVIGVFRKNKTILK